jgi:hypothetical protein
LAFFHKVAMALLAKMTNQQMKAATIVLYPAEQLLVEWLFARFLVHRLLYQLYFPDLSFLVCSMQLLAYLYQKAIQQSDLYFDQEPVILACASFHQAVFSIPCFD